MAMHGPWSPRALGVLGVICLLAASGLWIKGARAAASARHLSSRATATVVAVHELLGCGPCFGPQPLTSVTVAFNGARGARVRATQDDYTDSLKVGEKLRIVYDPQNPAHVSWSTAYSEAEARVIGGGFVLYGLGFLAAAFWRTRRRRTDAGRDAVTGGSHA